MHTTKGRVGVELFPPAQASGSPATAVENLASPEHVRRRLRDQRKRHSYPPSPKPRHFPARCKPSVEGCRFCQGLVSQTAGRERSESIAHVVFITPPTTPHLAARNAHVERSWCCSHRRITAGSTGTAVARVLGRLGTMEQETWARPRSARDSTGVERTGALGARDVSGEAWRETGARPDPARG